MLTHPTYEKLQSMRLFGMATALKEQDQQVAYNELSFTERIGLLVDREMTDRASRKLTIRLSKARLRQDAACEDIDFSKSRGLDRSLILALCQGEWLRRHNNCLVTGPTGVGKSYIACALANKACRDGCSVSYVRASRLFSELSIARADGSFAKRLAALARVDLLVVDDWGLASLTNEHARDFLEILEDRYDHKSTLVVSQVPVDNWHALMPDPTVADAALDRLVHNAYRISLEGESMRKRKSILTIEGHNSL
jgi:DNA replication protein DnaC